MSHKQITGSRYQVMHGTAKKTSGGLTKSHLKYNKQGKIVSKKASALAKKNNRLGKTGYVTRNNVVGVEMRGGVVIADPCGAQDKIAITTILTRLKHLVEAQGTTSIQIINIFNKSTPTYRDNSRLFTHFVCRRFVLSRLDKIYTKIKTISDYNKILSALKEYILKRIPSPETKYAKNEFVRSVISILNEILVIIEHRLKSMSVGNNHSIQSSKPISNSIPTNNNRQPPTNTNALGKIMYNPTTGEEIKDPNDPSENNKLDYKIQKYITRPNAPTEKGSYYAISYDKKYINLIKPVVISSVLIQNI